MVGWLRLQAIAGAPHPGRVRAPAASSPRPPAHGPRTLPQAGWPALTSLALRQDGQRILVKATTREPRMVWSMKAAGDSAPPPVCAAVGEPAASASGRSASPRRPGRVWPTACMASVVAAAGARGREGPGCVALVPRAGDSQWVAHFFCSAASPGQHNVYTMCVYNVKNESPAVFVWAARQAGAAHGAVQRLRLDFSPRAACRNPSCGTNQTHAHLHSTCTDRRSRGPSAARRASLCYRVKKSAAVDGPMLVAVEGRPALDR